MSTAFNEAIKNYLDQRAKEDSLFAEAYKKEGKTIEGCCNYIISEVQKSAKGNRAAMTSDEVFSLAVHYYDEDNVKADKKVNARVVVPAELISKDKASKSTVEKPKKPAKQKAVKKDPFEDRQLSLF
ncbi:Cas9 inhibitor AcrIIA9 family protein [uncultured Bacteroides sp.]|uniref:PcfK-like family protein n=1 Tax=uncultured Bacteroides sp. TaxID=162156 RepID=UPI00259742E0|nr:Cas9 inhibitor AcrIIA9 family protein [uncultured Bacteroides sp.]